MIEDRFVGSLRELKGTTPMSDVLAVVEQRDVRQAFESAGDGPWTVLYESAKDGDLDVLQWCNEPSNL